MNVDVIEFKPEFSGLFIFDEFVPGRDVFFDRLFGTDASVTVNILLEIVSEQYLGNNFASIEKEVYSFPKRSGKWYFTPFDKVIARLSGGNENFVQSFVDPPSIFKPGLFASLRRLAP